MNRVVNPAEIRFSKEITQQNVFVPQRTIVREKKRSLVSLRKMGRAFLVTMTILAAGFFLYFLLNIIDLRVKAVTQSEVITKLENKLEKEKQKNDSLENDLGTKFDVGDFFDTAVTSLNMKFPTEREIIRFNKSSGEYVRQNENIK